MIELDEYDVPADAVNALARCLLNPRRAGNRRSARTLRAMRAWWLSQSGSRSRAPKTRQHR